MKKFTVIGIVVALIIAVAGCKKKQAKKATKPTVTQQSTSAMKAPKDTVSKKDTTAIKDTVNTKDTTEIKDTTKTENGTNTQNTNNNTQTPKKKIKKKIR